MIKKILVANRGEIAMRIFRTCRVMNIATVAIYTRVDRGALHVRYAEEAYCISDSPVVVRKKGLSLLVRVPILLPEWVLRLRPAGLCVKPVYRSYRARKIR